MPVAFLLGEKRCANSCLWIEEESIILPYSPFFREEKEIQ